MLSDMSLAADMAAAATALLRARPEAGVAFGDPQRRWIEYRPEPRPGLSLADLAPGPRKAAHRLLATGLSPAAFAQAMAVCALEEVLDRREGGRRGRHSEDYRVIVFGTPGDDEWAWRFEGHHLSVSMTVSGGRVSPAPVFLGANPARVDALGRPVLRPLGVEEDLGRELLLSLPARARRVAVVADVAPYDIRTATQPRSAPIAPPGIARADLRPGERALLDQLVSLYLGRLPDELAAGLDPAGGELHFAWEGPPQPGTRHYYRIQGDDLLIEFDNTTDDGNHAHTVLRRPRGEFGGDILAAHHAGEPHTS
ncbi:DUF3500 domain-containing protein [Couchioplanes caeruleus]|uniref:DUF3500 domain-containing protein n=2 Tax=Couchioplanes caeruleus TaxID=56438 RepID=A0A1K0FBS4_9ACTN|nr:hypothetical protein BG844_32725 [Couchioplanes caeruleus subsp. caeruleus]ROP34231.1 uncharacterized protein DUF3500 [Couchioplanes caeruleus]